MEVSGQFHAPAALPTWKYLLIAMGTQNRSGRCGEEKISQPLPGLEPQIIQPVAQCCTTDLSLYLRDTDTLMIVAYRSGALLINQTQFNLGHFCSN
jgi:hypothetical protein